MSISYLYLLTCTILTFSCTATCPDDPPSPEGQGQAGAALNMLRVKGAEGRPLDIMYFNGDHGGRIDSYQHVEAWDGGPVETACGGGARKLVVALNAPAGMEDRIASYESLCRTMMYLGDEDPRNPVMTGEMGIVPGEQRELELSPEALMCRIRIESISCDFHGMAYEGQSLKDARAYVSNGRPYCPLVGSGTGEGLFNQGGRTDGSGAGKKAEAMLGDIGRSVIYPDANLYCYPEATEYETLGSPFTRLVIEGRIDGELCWYPININRGSWQKGEHSGLRRGTTYCFNITLTRKGNSDPDIPIESSHIRVGMRILGWEEQEEYIMEY